jgi:23S rRNA (uracil1939-C5)-methyltransferase
MSSRKKIIEQVTIEAPAAEGKCIAHVGGMAVFVEGAAPGDIADLRIVRKKKKYLEAVPERIHRYSSDRTEPFCAHFGTCGGCKWQHVRYDKQLEYKQRMVQDQFQRIAKVEFPEPKPIIGATDAQYYRNKLEFTFSDGKWLTREEIESGVPVDRRGAGFHVPGRYDKIVDIQSCHLQGGPSNDIRNFVRDTGIAKNLSFYNVLKHEGFLRNLVIRTTTSGEVMVILQVAQPDQKAVEALLESVIGRFPEITSVYYVVNTKKNETFHDLPLVHFAGKTHITETIGDLNCMIGPKSFFQTNPAQARTMYKLIADFAGLSGHELVADLYTGTGSIANYIAPMARRVIGIESVWEAIADARENAAHNNIENTEFLVGDLNKKTGVAQMIRAGIPDVVIADPPRAGLHPAVVEAFIESLPGRIVYVSCNPATQARDLAMLDSRYKVEVVQPLDMFPHTMHVENIVLLTRK